MKKILIFMFIFCLFFLITACDKEENQDNNNQNQNQDNNQMNQDDDDTGFGYNTETDVVLPDEVKENTNISITLYVQKVENLGSFIFGADISSLISLEQAGVKFYDFDGNEADIMKTMSENGINYIRVRIWNDPYDSLGRGYGGGNSDLAKAIEIGKRATKYGMKLLVDFHYSDFWADPVKQQIPKAWKTLEYEAVDEGEYTMDMALYEYTRDSLQALKDNGVDVGMVQIGNETNGYMCGTKAWDIIAKLMNAGSKAVREILPSAKVVLHFANPEKVERYPDYSSKLSQYKVDYDVFASSYYPYYHGTLENLAKVLSDVANTYGKQVMVAETSYAYCDEDFDQSGGGVGGGSGVVKLYPFSIQGQANHLRNLTDTLVNHTKNAIGIFYWEPAWLPVPAETYQEQVEMWNTYGAGWTSAYSGTYDKIDAAGVAGGTSVDNQALFDPTGHPLESLKVFGLMKDGNSSVENKIDGLDDVNLICDINEPVVLPETVNAVMYDNSRVSVPVTWNVTEADYIKWSTRGVNKYKITGTAEGLEAICNLSMIEYNYLQNYSFEESSKFDPWVVVERDKHCNELYVEESQNDSLTGTRHLHFWASGKDVVDFYVEQTIENLPAGSYKSSFAIMGNDGGTTEIYLYIKTGDQVLKTDNVQINGWKKWNYGIIEKFEHAGGPITVGISVKCSGTGAGAWAKIDDILLNQWSEPQEVDYTIPVAFTVTKPGVEASKSVYLTGDFNNWLALEDYKLTKLDDDTWAGSFLFNEDEEIKFKFIVADATNPGTDPNSYEWEENPDRLFTPTLDNDKLEAVWQGVILGNNKIRFSVDMSGVSGVTSMYLAGNFTDWGTNKIAMTKGENNIWSVEVELAYDVTYNFKFVMNGSKWEEAIDNRWITPSAQNKTFLASWNVAQSE